MTVEGSVVVTNSLDVAALATVCVVTGDLNVAANGLIALSLPLLASVGGVVGINGNAALTSISLPLLASAGGVDIQGNSALTSIALPVLASAGGVSINNNSALTSCTGALIEDEGDCGAL